ncbi:hypothetical protein [Streptomyces sp. LN245]
MSVLLPTAHEPYNERPGLFLRHVLPFLENPRAVTARRLKPPSRPRSR